MEDLIERYEHIKEYYYLYLLVVIMVALKITNLFTLSQGNYTELYPWENTLADVMRVAGHNFFVFMRGILAGKIAFIMASLAALSLFIMPCRPKMAWVLDSILGLGFGIAAYQFVVCVKSFPIWG